MASDLLTGAIAQNDQSVRVLGHQLFIQPMGNLVPPRAPLLCGGDGCVRAKSRGVSEPSCDVHVCQASHSNKSTQQQNISA